MLYARRWIYWGCLIVTFGLAGFIIRGAALHDTAGFWGQTTAAWLQAVGSILAIAGGFAVANYQLHRANAKAMLDKLEEAQAVATLAHRVVEQVADRLLVATRPFSKKVYGLALREHRTTELVELLRQINLGSLPSNLVVAFSSLRSNLYAVNSRITEIYHSEEEQGISENKRERRIRSSLIVYDSAIENYVTILKNIPNPEKIPLNEQPELRQFVNAAKARQAADVEARINSLPE